MKHEIVLEPSGIRFHARDDQSIVAAASGQGIAIRHGCGNGSCGDCKGVVLEGEGEQLPFMPLLLTPEERAARMAILCRLQPRTPMRIQARVQERETWQATVLGVGSLAGNVRELRLQTSRPYRYQAGQYARIAVPGQDGEWRSYSMARPPAEDGTLVFHIRAVPEGRFGTWLFHQARPGDVLTLGAAQGEFFLRRDTEKPILCVAAGTGLAPIEAILQETLDMGWRRPIHLFYGARRRKDFYHLSLLEEWTRQYGHLQVTPTLSDMEDHDWGGARRLLPTVAAHGPWKEHQAYLCGSPAMIEAAVDLLLSHGLPHEQIHFDAFSPNS